MNKLRIDNRRIALMLAWLLIVSSMLVFAGPKPAAAAAGFYVNGTTLYDSTGQPFKMRGINHPHSWFKNEAATAMQAIAATGANTVRIVLSNGTQYTKDNTSAVSNLLSLANQHKLIAVLEVHDATGSDSTAALDSAVNYWIELKNVLAGKEDRVIINIANEWYGTWNSTGWANGYKSAIPKLRNAGLTHTLIVDAAGWGQYPQSIVDQGQAVLNSDPLRNTMFSIHMYEYAGGNAAQVQSNIDNVLNKGLALIIGEFGHWHSNGDVDEGTIMSYSQQRGVGWLAWSWKGNSQGLEYLDLSHDWAGTNLTSWGNTIVHGANGLKQTSTIAPIFGGGSGGGGGGGSGYVKLQNRATSLYADGMGRTSNGSNAGQWANSPNYNQQWVIEAAGSYVKIKNRATGLYLDGMGRTANGSEAGQWSGGTSHNQQWTQENAGSGYVRFKNRATGLYLDGMGRTANGSDIGQWSNSGSYNQQWRIIGA